jgi:hypothetical protein
MTCSELVRMPSAVRVAVSASAAARCDPPWIGTCDHAPSAHLVRRRSRLTGGTGDRGTAEQLDPTDAACFRDHVEAFDRSLDPLRTTIAAIRAHHPGAGVAYTERVPWYLRHRRETRLHGSKSIQRFLPAVRNVDHES